MAENSKTRCERFVQYVLERAKIDAGFAAKLRRADNPDTAEQSWGILAQFGVNLERDNEYLPFALIGAALCRTDYDKDGASNLGSALAASFDDFDRETNPASSRLRRLLACSNIREACRILRPILSLINSKSGKQLCYANLLNDLLYFNSAGQERIKKRWAMDFYALKETATAGKDRVK